ncbi:MAG: hypothetical protein JST40_00570 [Armatimonadetes bacterium]|nr:hypothetical protein [Armatimonadota bacterium]
MSQGFRFNADLHLTTQTKVDPRIVLTSKLIELSSIELETAISREIEENPALERVEEEEATEENRPEDILSKVSNDHDDYESRRGLPDRDEEANDWLDYVSDLPDLQDHLEAQLLPRLEPQFRNLGSFVIGSLNEHGYLGTPIEEIAMATGNSFEEIEAVIAQLQQCEPRGVGARGVVECLILQLSDEDDNMSCHAKLLLTEHLTDLIARNAKSLAKKLCADIKYVYKLFDHVSSLNPYPAEGFSVGPSSLQASHAHRAQPEIVLTRSEIGWTVETPGYDQITLKVNHQFQKHAEKGENHARHYVVRANRFLQALGQRRNVLHRIGRYLIENQAGFVTTGQFKFVNELTRSKMAKDLGVHESTISRATMDKFVQIATGEIISFDLFFDSSLKIKQLIAEILAYENPNNRLSDEKISKLLADQGIKVARRTVNKYRDHSKLLNSRKRRAA